MTSDIVEKRCPDCQQMYTFQDGDEPPGCPLCGWSEDAYSPGLYDPDVESEPYER